MSDIITIKIHNNGSIGVWTDSNHQADLPKPQFNTGDTVTYLDNADNLVTGTIEFVYRAQDVQDLHNDKGRYCWHYGIDFVDGYPKTYRSEWELLDHNPKSGKFKYPLLLLWAIGMDSEKLAELSES